MKRFSFRVAAASAAILGFTAAPLWAEENAPAKPAEKSAAVAAPASSPAPESKAAASGEASKAEGKAAEKQEPVAVVNGTAIPKAEFDRAFSAYMQSTFRANGGMTNGLMENEQAMREEVVQQVVDRELLYQESKKFPIPDLSQRVESELKEIRARFPNPETFAEALKAQDLTDTALTELLGRQVSVRTYVEKQIEPSVKVSDEEVKKFYEENKARFVTPEQVRASHLLVLLPEGSKPEDEAYKKAKAKAEELRKRAAGGEDFAKLCRENSEDPGSKDQGGDLGFFTKDRMVEPFANAAFALKVSEVSPVVETQFGFHIIKLTERQDAVQHGFDELKEDISNYLKGQALDAAVKTKLAELRKTAKIEIPGAKK